MILDGILESKHISLIESYLVEDKMVKYDGELAPKFGWCVIYVGGPGSGKGTATNYKSRLEGDYFNVDNLKEIERMWQIKDPETGRPRELDFETPSEKDTKMVRKPVKWENSIVQKLDDNGEPMYKDVPVEYDKNRNMGNSEFVSELHMSMKPLSKKWKKSILDNPENAEDARRDRLPNLIFDITGDEVSKIMEIVDHLKPVGYKIAVIWIISTIEMAYNNNQKRKRKVDVDNVFIPKHRDVILAQEELFETGLISEIDEFWVIDAASKVDPFDDPVGYHDIQNVYHVPCTPDGLEVFDEITNRIKQNKKELDNLVKERSSK